MNIENMSREELVDVIKKHCVKVITDFPNTNFKAGEYYFYEDNEAGPFLIDDNGKYFDLYELNNPYEYLENR